MYWFPELLEASQRSQEAVEKEVERIREDLAQASTAAITASHEASNLRQQLAVSVGPPHHTVLAPHLPIKTLTNIKLQQDWTFIKLKFYLNMLLEILKWCFFDPFRQVRL